MLSINSLYLYISSKIELLKSLTWKDMLRSFLVCLMSYAIGKGVMCLGAAFMYNDLNSYYKDWVPATAHVIQIKAPRNIPKDGSAPYYTSLVKYSAAGTVRRITKSVEGPLRYQEGQDIKIKYNPKALNDYHLDDGYDSGLVRFLFAVGSAMVIFPLLILFILYPKKFRLFRKSA